MIVLLGHAQVGEFPPAGGLEALHRSPPVLLHSQSQRRVSRSIAPHASEATHQPNTLQRNQSDPPASWDWHVSTGTLTPL